jgi:hypothetical protein
MALSSQDLVKGIDLTGYTEVTAGDLNNIVDLASPKSDGGTDGKGLVVRSQDALLDTPTVPNADVTTKWKRYVWVRIPFGAATDHTPKMYAWNDNTTPDATLLHWVEITQDLSTIEADITALETAVGTAQSTADSATALYNGLSASVASAAEDASQAINLAEGFNDTLTTQGAAITQNTTDITALETTMTEVTADIDRIDALAGANPDIVDCVPPVSSRGFPIIVDYNTDVIVARDPIKDYIKVAERSTTGSALGDGANQILFDAVVTDTDSNVTLSSNKVTVNKGGVFLVKMFTGARATGGADITSNIINDGTAAVLAIGTYCKPGGSGGYVCSHISAIVTITAATVLKGQIIVGANSGSLERKPTPGAGITGTVEYSTLELIRLKA